MIERLYDGLLQIGGSISILFLVTTIVGIGLWAVPHIWRQLTRPRGQGDEWWLD